MSGHQQVGQADLEEDRFRWPQQETKARPVNTPDVQPRVSRYINDKYCVNAPVFLADMEQRDYKSLSVQTLKFCRTVKPCQTEHTLDVYSPVVNRAHIVKGQAQKKGVSPDIFHCQKLKCVKDVSCVSQLSFVQPVTNVPPVVLELPVGARLHAVFKKQCSRTGQKSEICMIFAIDYF